MATKCKDVDLSISDGYERFIIEKSQLTVGDGFEPVWMPDFLYDFQVELVDWAIRHGRTAIFADCGLGKTPMQLVWAENVIRKTGGNVLIITPLAVSAQTIEEGEKFGIEVRRSIDGTAHDGITITNYERLHHFNPKNFAGAVCDESSAIKNFNGARRAIVTDFMRKLRYRLLCTATAAPNDYIELGTSSEALGYLGHVDMLGRFLRTGTRPSTRRGGGEGSLRRGTMRTLNGDSRDTQRMTSGGGSVHGRVLCADRRTSDSPMTDSSCQHWRSFTIRSTR